MMRRWLAGCLLVVCLPCFAQSTPSDATQRAWVAQHPTVRVALDPQLGAELGPGRSNPLTKSVLSVVAGRSGLRFEFVPTLSWAASVDAFRAGKVDILPSLTDAGLTPDLRQHALLSRAYYEGSSLLIGRHASGLPIDISLWDGRTLAFKQGGIYEAWLKEHHPGIRRLPLSDVQAVLTAVESGVADGALGMDVVYAPLVRRDHAATLAVIGSVPTLAIAVRVMVPSSEPELLAIVDTSLQAVTEREQQSLISRWMEAAYLRAPTVSLVVRHYQGELVLASLLLAAMIFALYQMRRAQVASRHEEQRKGMLLAVMSHEVRNAVNALSASVELLAQSQLHNLDAEQREVLATAQTSSRHLLRLLHHALDYSRSTTIAIEHKRSDVFALARHCLNAVRPLVDPGRVTLELELPCGPLPWMLVDEGRLEQVLSNLLTNAVKFTDKGRIGIAVWQEALADGNEGVLLIVEVFDTGIGIPEARQTTLFTPFVQAHHDGPSRAGGTGLGLSICREIVTSLSGRLTFTSEEGVGTSFRVELPVTLPSVEEIDPGVLVSLSPVRPSGRAVTVLLVEDHPANRHTIRAQLHHLGLHCHVVALGEAALAAMTAHCYLAVLLDCELPDMDGYDVAREQRRRERHQDRPRQRLIAISARTDAQHDQRCLGSGMDLVLGKPLTLERLKGALFAPDTWARTEHQEKDAARRSMDAEIDALERLIAAGTDEQLQRFAHRLKGAALMLGAYRVASLAEDLETELASHQVANRASLQLLVDQLGDAWRIHSTRQF